MVLTNSLAIINCKLFELVSNVSTNEPTLSFVYAALPLGMATEFTLISLSLSFYGIQRQPPNEESTKILRSSLDCGLKANGF